MVEISENPDHDGLYMRRMRARKVEKGDLLWSGDQVNASLNEGLHREGWCRKRV